jgi:hypothetical protein
MAEPIIITNTAGSLGDYLSTTVVFKNNRHGKVICIDSIHSRNFACVYDGIADVEFKPFEEVENTKETGEELCFSQRILNYHNITDTNAIPEIKLTKDEIEFGIEFVKKYENPVAVNFTSGSAGKDHKFANYRRIPTYIRDVIINGLKSEGKQLLRFGVKQKMSHIYQNYEEILDIIDVPDLSIRETAACYKAIGSYYGADTGDHHLMLSVGGSCHVFVPPSCWHYNHKKHLYFDYAWRNERVREVYTQFLTDEN